MSTKKKEDPRTIRTKEMFKNAVFALLSEDSNISNLSVQKIATKAELNRTTFYLHYQDIDDFLTHITNDMINELTEKINQLIHATKLSKNQQLIQLYDYLYSHRLYLLSLFRRNQFEEQLFSLLRQLVETRRKNVEVDLPEDYVSVEIRTASLVGVIMWWLQNGAHYSSEYIANQIYLLHKSK